MNKDYRIIEIKVISFKTISDQTDIHISLIQLPKVFMNSNV